MCAYDRRNKRTEGVFNLCKLMQCKNKGEKERKREREREGRERQLTETRKDFDEKRLVKVPFKDFT